MTGRHLIESRAPGRRRMPDLKGAWLFALGVGLLTFAIVEGPTEGWESAIVLVPAALAAISATPSSAAACRIPSPSSTRS